LSQSAGTGSEVEDSGFCSSVAVVVVGVGGSVGGSVVGGLNVLSSTFGELADGDSNSAVAISLVYERKRELLLNKTARINSIKIGTIQYLTIRAPQNKNVEYRDYEHWKQIYHQFK